MQVADIVAQLMVANIIRNAALAAKHLGLLFRLDALRASGDTTTGDTMANEPIVVTPAIKGNERIVQALLGVPVDVEIAQLLRPNGVDVIPGIVDLVRKVGAGEHVVVHEEADFLVLLLGQVLDVEVGPEQALLLAGPPGKAHAVVDAEVGELGGNLEQGQAAGAVVVDTGAFGDRVAVAAEHDAVVGVTLLGLGDDVVGDDSLDNGVNIGRRVNLLAGLELGDVGRRLGARKTEGGDVVRGGRAESAGDGVVLVVVDHGGDGACLAGILGLGAEGAGAAADEGDVAGDPLGEVLLFTAVVLDQDELAVHRLLVLRRRGQAHWPSRLWQIQTDQETRLEDVA